MQELRFEYIFSQYYENEPRKFVELIRSYIKESDEIGQDSIHLRELFFEKVEQLAIRTDNSFITSGLGVNELFYHTLQSLVDLLIIRKDKTRLAQRFD